MNLRSPALRPAESLPWRWTCVVLALIVCAAFYLMVSQTNVSAYPGVDQNGYLVGGKMLLEHGTAGYQPTKIGSDQPDPYAFVGRMWIGVDLGTPHERYYPKYPLGYPVLIAAADALSGPALAYAINPLAMALGVLFTFLLIREIAGSTLALLAMILFASLPATMQLANNPNSHATALFCVAGAMFFLFSWLRHAGWHRIALAGFLAGYAATIRYTEGLLILPLLIAWLTTLKPMRTGDDPSESVSKHPWRDGCILLIAWLIPVGALVAYNLVSFGSLTGYDPCNESTGFRLEYADDNWLTMLEQFGSRGMALFFPFAIAGLIALWKWRWRLAVVLWAWTIPPIITYTFYYWAPDNLNSLGYMRFFLTVVPGLLAAAMAMLAGLMEFGYDESLHITLRRFWITIAGALVAVAMLLNLGDAIPDLLVDQVRRLALADRTRCIEAVAPPGSVIFSNETDVLHHLQFVADYKLYSADIFSAPRVEAMGDADVDEPLPFQPQRQLALYDLLKDKTSGELWDIARQIALDARQAGKRVYVIDPIRIFRGRRAPSIMQPLMSSRGWTSRQVAEWANTTTADHPPGDRMFRHTPRRADPLANYRTLRDTGRLVEIIPPSPTQAAPAGQKKSSNASPPAPIKAPR